jgi:phage I-like protein
MAHPKASPDLLPRLPPDVAAGVVTIDAAALAAGGDAEPVWIRVTPRGEIVTRDGRRYTFEPERLVARFAADGIDVPIDIDHAISRKPMFGDRADAVGWVRELKAQPDGTYARIELLDAGKAALAAKTHRFVSPTFKHTDTGLATWLHSVALVAAPALAMPAIASADLSNDLANPENTMLKALAKALGLADTADEATCLAAIVTLQADLAGKVDKAVHEQALANLAAVTGQLDAIKTAGRKVKVEGVIEAALTAKKIMPAQKTHYLALCATDDGLAQVEALLAATPAGLQASGLDTRAAPDADTVGDPAMLAARAVEYQKKLAESGQIISTADAVIAVAAAKENRP